MKDKKVQMGVKRGKPKEIDQRQEENYTVLREKQKRAKCMETREETKRKAK